MSWSADAMASRRQHRARIMCMYSTENSYDRQLGGGDVDVIDALISALIDEYEFGVCDGTDGGGVAGLACGSLQPQHFRDGRWPPLG